MRAEEAWTQTQTGVNHERAEAGSDYSFCRLDVSARWSFVRLAR